MPPRSFLLAIVLACVLLAAANTSFQAQEEEDVRLTTKRQALIFAGPGEPFPLLITFGAGVTLQVVARSENGDWLIVAVGPFLQGWIAAIDGDLSASTGDLIVRYPDLALLPTPTAVKNTMQIEIKLYPADKSTTGVGIILVNPKLNIFYEAVVTASNGKVVFKKQILAKREGYYNGFFIEPGSLKAGTYTVVVTSGDGESATRQFTISTKK